MTLLSDAAVRWALFAFATAGVGCFADASRFTGGHRDGDTSSDATASDAAPVRDVSDGGQDTGDVSTVLDASGDTVDAAREPDTNDGRPGDAPIEACSGVVGAREICNGVDDNCNYAIDEGCPDRLSVGLPSDRAMLGTSPGGSFATDPCGPDRVLAGFNVWMTGYMVMLADACAAFSLTVDTSTTPYRYGVAIANAALTSRRWGAPDATSQVSSLICPDNYLVVGASVTVPTTVGFDVLTSMTVQCARLVVEQNADSGAYAVSQVQVMTLPAAKGTIFKTTDVPHADTLAADRVPIQVNGWSGMWVDRIGLSDAKMTVLLKGGG